MVTPKEIVTVLKENKLMPKGYIVHYFIKSLYKPGRHDSFANGLVSFIQDNISSTMSDRSVRNKEMVEYKIKEIIRINYPAALRWKVNERNNDR